MEEWYNLLGILIMLVSIFVIAFAGVWLYVGIYCLRKKIRRKKLAPKEIQMTIWDILEDEGVQMTIDDIMEKEK